MTFSEIIATIDGWLWGLPLIIVLLGTHLFMTIRTGFIQKYTFKGIKLSVKPDPDSDGEVSQFGALATALAATIGTGNIVGVATAFILGGPGAIFWMWITGVFGIASKYGETLISVKYRVQTEDGRMLGGAMMALERGLNAKWLAVIFAILATFASFGIGCMTQANSIATALNQNFNIPNWVGGVLIAFFVGIVILGGVKSITKVCEKLVPFMALLYVVGCIVILVLNYDKIGPGLLLIIKCAFSAKAGLGGLGGIAMGKAIQYGCARGLFSNESAMGSAPLVAAAAKTRNPVRQSLVSMTGTFWDTVVICLITGLTLTTGVLKHPEFLDSMTDKSVLTFTVFSEIPVVGTLLITVAIALFAYSTLLGWSYYGEKAAEYLVGPKVIYLYKIVFTVFAFVGAVSALELVWNIADILNGLMVIPNVIGMIGLSGVIVAETKKYINDIDLRSDDVIPVISKGKKKA